MSPEMAETTALRALEWLVANDELLPIFMGSSGLDQDSLRASATDSEFLSSVLDFLLMDDQWVTSVCDRLNLPYEQLMQARMALPGGAQIHWT